MVIPTCRVRVYLVLPLMHCLIACAPLMHCLVAYEGTAMAQQLIQQPVSRGISML